MAQVIAGDWVPVDATLEPDALSMTSSILEPTPPVIVFATLRPDGEPMPDLPMAKVIACNGVPVAATGNCVPSVATRNLQGLDEAARESVTAPLLTAEGVTEMTRELEEGVIRVLHSVSREATEMCSNLKKAQDKYKEFTHTRLECKRKMHEQDKNFSEEYLAFKKREREEKQLDYKQEICFKKQMIDLQMLENKALAERTSLLNGVSVRTSSSTSFPAEQANVSKTQSQLQLEERGQQGTLMKEEAATRAVLGHQVTTTDAMTEGCAALENVGTSAMIEQKDATSTVKEAVTKPGHSLATQNVYLTESNNEQHNAMNPAHVTVSLQQLETTIAQPEVMQSAATGLMTSPPEAIQIVTARSVDVTLGVPCPEHSSGGVLPSQWHAAYGGSQAQLQQGSLTYVPHLIFLPMNSSAGSSHNVGICVPLSYCLALCVCACAIALHARVCISVFACACTDVLMCVRVCVCLSCHFACTLFVCACVCVCASAVTLRVRCLFVHVYVCVPTL